MRAAVILALLLCEVFSNLVTTHSQVMVGTMLKFAGKFAHLPYLEVRSTSLQPMLHAIFMTSSRNPWILFEEGLDWQRFIRYSFFYLVPKYLGCKLAEELSNVRDCT